MGKFSFLLHFLHTDLARLRLLKGLLRKAARKLPKVSISDGLKFFAIMQESVAAKVTNSQPDGHLQEFIFITFIYNISAKNVL